MKKTIPSRADLQEAHRNGNVFCKAENMQKVGAFKFRGACNAIFSSPGIRSVATHSSGNHAQAVALSAKLRQIPAYIVMPKTAAQVKVDAVKGYGGIVTMCEPNLASRETTLEKVVRDTGATEIHPYDDYRIIAGAATACMELIEHCQESDVLLDYVLAPVGGGGLLAGTALACKYFSPNTQVVGCEPTGADDAFRSFASSTLIPSEDPNTICDGLLTSLGTKNFEIIQNEVSAIHTVTDEETIAAMRFVWERMKILIEPSSAVAFAVLFQKRFTGKIGVIISGGNVDLEKLPW